MSTASERLLICMDLCKNYKIENSVKKCINYCTHEHLVRMIIKPKPSLQPSLLPLSSPSPVLNNPTFFN